MFLNEVEAEAALAALRRQRDALDRQIADHALYLELGRRLGAGSAALTTPAPAEPTRAPTEAPEARPGEDIAAARRHGRALVAAALDILHEANRPLHAGEILPGLTARGFDLPGHDPVAALNTRLWKRSGPGGPLRRLGDAVYAPSEEEADRA
ncbi:hypothetical protein ASG60_16360 [Methylobacterium sp. Leaf469]|uniref:hypothetical protein n=1 Tax=Methylobacterium sp. Leaf469 TaxID=1736387 RepID=UPI0006F2A7AE|nr:hypothetical protein [Methylobacterium sp. Leaf469]KQU04919.1 hypothetical protein ASG60_16360 [Methylobacterium sp. Leaf469]